MKTRILAGALLLSPLSLHAATTVYTANFDAAPVGTNLPSPFVENGAGTTNNSSIFENSPGDNVLLQRVANTSAGTTAAAANTTAAITFTDLGGSPATAMNFSVSTSFRINENTLTNNNGSTFNISLGALGDNSNLGNGNRYMLTYTLRSPGGNQEPGSLSINEVATGAGGMTTVTGKTAYSVGGPPATQVGVSSTINSAAVNDVLYTLTLTGVYTSGTLRLTGTLTGENGANLIVVADDTSPRTGTYFGVRTALNAIGSSGNNAAGTLETEFETFEVIPEPGSIALLGLGLGALGLRRKRA